MAASALSDVLLARAESQPDGVVYERIDAEGTVRSLRYAQVAARASALAAQLVAGGAGPVLLAQPAGPDYAVAVFAAFLAGRPVIPAYPSSRSSSDGDRLAGIVADARPTAVIAPSPDPGIPVRTTLSVPGAAADSTPLGRPSGAFAQDVAIVQYTSGSTGRPRGVLVRHDSLLANTAAIAEAFGLTAESRSLTWLPPFHDMGLVGGLLTPVRVGIPARVLDPADFLASPLRWLRQITESGATASGAPNFAYELCVRRVRRPDQLDGLDLSRWTVAFNGGEPVRSGTLVAFTETFAPAGFRPEAFVPCYGLAEATLMVSAGRWPAAPTPGASVSSGRPVTGQRVAIVDPDRGVRIDGEGEIWLSGPHVTAGYLGHDTPDLFGELDGERYLRTGDLGMLRAGQLHVTGRVKDVLIVHGANHHATDVESAAAGTPGVDVRTAAAFVCPAGADPGPGERAVLVAETRGRRTERVAADIRATVLGRTGLRLDQVVLTPAGSVPRTSSGKVRRAACRDAFQAGAFAGAVSLGTGPDPHAGVDAGREEPDHAVAELTALLCGIAAAVCDRADCGPDDILADVGVDSVRAAEAAAVLEDAVGLPVPMEALFAGATARRVAGHLVDRWARADIPRTRVVERLDTLVGASR